MLTEGSVRRRVSQAPLKDGFCFAGCGEAIRFRTNPQVCCPKCRIARKRRSARESMDKKRRSRGIPKVKGLLIRCVGCGIEVVLNRNAEARFCRSCYLENNRLAARKRSKERASTDAGRQYAREYERRKRRTDPSFRVSAHNASANSPRAERTKATAQLAHVCSIHSRRIDGSPGASVPPRNDVGEQGQVAHRPRGAALKFRVREARRRRISGGLGFDEPSPALGHRQHSEECEEDTPPLALRR